MADVVILKQRPLTVEAMLVPADITGRDQVAKWCNGWLSGTGGVALVDDRRFRQHAAPGDYIIRAANGFYPAPADVVHAKYEPVL